MLSRLVIIITCISLIGATIVPASAIPCCCKSTQANDRGQNGMPGARAETGPSCCSVTAVKTPSCCATKSVQVSCTRGTVRAECPRCRCLEQMQIVALSGYSAGENSTRVPAVTLAAVTPFPLAGSDSTVNLGPEAGSRDIVISLQTCTLRC
jgi:hypothetical protein